MVFEPDFRTPEALRGLEGFSHIWLIWEFSKAISPKWSPTVRPPRLGGNARMGVFATRSPFRPNPIGLSSVGLLGVEEVSDFGWVLRVSGGDLMDGTPIYDIKPYLPYADCHPHATGGFAGHHGGETLPVACPPSLLERVPQGKQRGLLAVLSHDPRPSYQDDPTRVYGMEFGGVEVKFTVSEEGVTVVAVEPLGGGGVS